MFHAPCVGKASSGRLEHQPVVKGEQEVRLQCGEHGNDRGIVRVFRGDHRDLVAGRQFRDAVEPDGFVRIVLVGYHHGHIDTMRQQHRQAAHAHVVVGEDNGAAHFGVVALEDGIDQVAGPVAHLLIDAAHVFAEQADAEQRQPIRKNISANRVNSPRPPGR
jgi:hypothetical protein